jgi:hypothetical protein
MNKLGSDSTDSLFLSETAVTLVFISAEDQLLSMEANGGSLTSSLPISALS